MLVRYWFEFHSDGRYLPGGVGLGCGVTAESQDVALEMISQRIFMGEPLPSVRRVTEGVDVSELDPGHVLPNMGDVSKRGIWFPLGYE